MYLVGEKNQLVTLRAGEKEKGREGEREVDDREEEGRTDHVTSRMLRGTLAEGQREGASGKGIVREGGMELGCQGGRNKEEE